jgi:hypothetical protein
MLAPHGSLSLGAQQRELVLLGCLADLAEANCHKLKGQMVLTDY